MAVFAAVSVLLFVVVSTAPDLLPEHFFVLTLAIVIGYTRSVNVHHAPPYPVDERHQRHLRGSSSSARCRTGVDDTAVRVLAFVAGAPPASTCSAGSPHPTDASACSGR